MPRLALRSGVAPRSLAAAVLSCTLFLPAAAAWAQAEPAPKTAEQLFNEGLGLMEAGDLAKACPKLEESQQVEAAVGTLLYLGECYDRQGRAADALATFHAAAEAARQAGQIERARIASERAKAVEARSPKLEISVPDASWSSGLRIEYDGVVERLPERGVTVPVEPGAHLVRVTAPGKIAWSTTVVVAPGQTTSVVRIPPLADEAPAAPGPLTVAASPAADATNLSRAWQVGGSVAGGLGLVGIVVGAVLGAKAKGHEAESEQYCDPPDYALCTGDGVDLIDRAHREALVSDVAFIVGGIALAAGLTLVIAAPTMEGEPQAESTRARVDLRAAAGSSNARLELHVHF
jgi:hypothetical protein